VFGAFVAAHGLISVYASVRSRLPGRQRLWLLVQGLVSIGFGVIAFGWTDMTELALLYFVGAWAIVLGTIGVVAGAGLPARRGTKLLILLESVLSIVFGVVMFASPDTGALALAALIAAFAIVTGTVTLTLGFELRRYGTELGRSMSEAGIGTAEAPAGAVTQL
jgi:uncharacterized membrane protein HdeD (DUF308 family)